jgi:hypothetical protein
MKSSPLPRMLRQAWLRVEPKWSRNVSSAERNNCDVTAAPQAPVLFLNGECQKRNGPKLRERRDRFNADDAKAPPQSA